MKSEPGGSLHCGADLTKHHHCSFRKLSGHAVQFCKVLGVRPDLWSECIAKNSGFAVEQLQCSAPAGILCFQGLQHLLGTGQWYVPRNISFIKEFPHCFDIIFHIGKC